MSNTNQIDTSWALNLSGLAVNILVAGLSIASALGQPVLPAVIVVTAIELVCFVAYLWLPSDRRRYLVTLLWLQALAIITLYFLVYNSVLGILGIVWIVQAINLYPPRRAAWFLAISVLILFASLLYHHGQDELLEIALTALSFGLFQMFALGASLQAISERRHREETATLNRELIATRELLRQTSAQSERLRIARDLHDILGHHMTALILNLEVAKHQLEGEPQNKVEQSLALAKLLLSDLRSTVSELREDDAIDLLKSIDKLVAGVPQLEVNVESHLAPTIKDIEVAETLLRCVQEGLTNVLRHSNGSRCEIVLEGREDFCVLLMQDNGDSASAEIKPGNGLKGMQERLHALGGHLEFHGNKNGFKLQARLPLEACN